MASTARIDELKKKFDENPRRYFAPLANEFRKAGDIEQAIVICEEFLPQQPGHMSGHIVYGQALYEAGKMPESRAVFETALSLDPENLIALRHLGDIAQGQGDHAAARTWYVRVLDADPRNEEIQALIATVDGDGPTPGAPVDPVSFDAPGFEMGFDIEKDVAPFEPEPVVNDVPPAAAQASEPGSASHGTIGQSIDPSLADTAPFGVEVIPPPLPTAAPSNEVDLLEGFSLHGFEAPPATGTAMGGSAPAEGLESTAFMPPDEHIPGTGDLDDSLDSGVPSFSPPAERIESLAGLQGSGGIAHAQLDDSAPGPQPDPLVPLDLDDGLVLPPQGDPLATASHEMTSDEATPSSAKPEPAAERHEPATHDAPSSDEVLEDAAPLELPPEVIAAEAGLIDAGETPAPPAPIDSDVGVDMELVDEPVSRPPFVTETMAELYLAQGFPEQARAVYEQLLAAHPGDGRLSGLVASLAAQDQVADAGPNVRDFFARLAGRRPGTRSAAAVPPADDDFAPPVPVQDELLEHVDAPAEDAPYSVAEAGEYPAETSVGEPVAAVAAVVAVVEVVEVAPDESLDDRVMAPEAVAPAIMRAAAMRTPAGSIDTLFGNRPAGTSEDSAAAALAQAFGGGAEVAPLIAGRPAHAAAGELSLDSVFRDGPARPSRTSQSFSFDQFFTGGAERSSTQTPQRTSAEVAMPGEAPAERSADDIEQFNSWLQGLKQR